MDMKELERKREALKEKIKAHRQCGNMANFAILNGLDYNSLAGTVSGRRPERAIIHALIKILGLKPSDFPRLPNNFNPGSDAA